MKIIGIFNKIAEVISRLQREEGLLFPTFPDNIIIDTISIVTKSYASSSL